MRVLIDIGHPAHVHYFRNLAKILLEKGNSVLFTTRDKEVTLDLLTHYGFRFVNFGKSFKTRLGKIFGLVYFTIRLFFVALRFKPDIYLNATVNSAFVAWLLRKPHISIEDTFNLEQVRLYRPFTSAVLTGSYTHPDLGTKDISYHGYQELLYLHPKRFQPDADVLNHLGVQKNEKYVILRLVSWGASHDYGHHGISRENKKRFVSILSKYARVFISSEGALDEDLQDYKIRIPPQMMHDALAFAYLFVGESATMASECAVLGTPAVYLDNTGRLYTDEEEKRYSLVFNYSESVADQEKALQKCIELLNKDNLKEEWQKRRERMLQEKIDPTAFLVWFVQNFPESFKTMKENSDFQWTFR